MNIQKLISRLSTLNDYGLVDILQKILNKHSKDITELNKKQLEKGEKSDGSFLRQYATSTIKIRQLEGNPVKGNLIALYDTGDFWRGFWSLAYDGKLELLSSDKKTNMLIEQYGEGIFGLTQDSFEQLYKIILPELRSEIYKFIKQ